MPSRRDFLRWGGVGAAASVALGAPESFGQILRKRSKVIAETSVAGGFSEKSAAKKTFKLGVATYTFREFPLDKALAMVKRVGLSRICIKDFYLPLNATPEKIAEVVGIVKKAGVEIYGCGPIYMKDEKEVVRALDYTKLVGCKTLVAVPPPKVLPFVSDKAKEYDINIAIHNHGPGDKLYPTPDIIYKYIKDLDPHVGFCIDIGHTMRSGVDPSEMIEKYADRLYDLHMKDVSAATGKGNTLETGRGVIDLVKVVRTLNKIGYKYVAGFEYEKDGKDPLPGLAESVGYIRGIQAAV